MKLTAEVKTTGPIFQSGAPASVRRATQGAIRELVELGEQRLDQVLRPRPAGVYLSVEQAKRGKASTGHYRRNLHATVQELNGKIDNPVIYGPYLEFGRGRFKGYAMWRNTAQWLQRQAAGVLQSHVNRLVRDLS